MSKANVYICSPYFGHTWGYYPLIARKSIVRYDIIRSRKTTEIPKCKVPPCSMAEKRASGSSQVDVSAEGSSAKRERTDVELSGKAGYIAGQQ